MGRASRRRRSATPSTAPATPLPPDGRSLVRSEQLRRRRTRSAPHSTPTAITASTGIDAGMSGVPTGVAAREAIVETPCRTASATTNGTTCRRERHGERRLRSGDDSARTLLPRPGCARPLRAAPALSGVGVAAHPEEAGPCSARPARVAEGHGTAPTLQRALRRPAADRRRLPARLPGREARDPGARRLDRRHALGGRRGGRRPAPERGRHPPPPPHRPDRLQGRGAQGRHGAARPAS